MKKKVFVFVYHDLVRVGAVEDGLLKEVLSQNGFPTVQAMYKADSDSFLEEFCYNSDVDSESYFDKINGIKVLEADLSEDRPFDLIKDKWDSVKDIKKFVQIQIKRIPISKKGLAFEQISHFLGDCAEMIVDANFTFDPSKLKISGPDALTYGGKKYQYTYCAGDDNGDCTFYYNGAQLK